MLVGVQAAQGDGLHAAAGGQRLRVLEAQAGLLVDSNRSEPQAVAYPLVLAVLVQQPRAPVLEAPVYPLGPKVFGLDDVGVR